MTINTGDNCLVFCGDNLTIDTICINNCSGFNTELIEKTIETIQLCTGVYTVSFVLDCIDKGWFDYQLKSGSQVVKNGQVYSNG